MLSSRRTRLTTGLALGVGLLGAGLAPSISAAASKPAAISAPDQSLSASTSPQWQTNNTASAIAVSHGTLYAGGAFTAIRPPGAALGKSSVARSHLAAFSTTTGAPTSFAPKLNGAVDALAVSPDGSTLYVGGAFTTVNGTARSHAAAFTVATGALTPWSPKVAGKSVNAIATYGTTVYLGGVFTSIGGTAHRNLAAVSATGAGPLLHAFTATASDLVSSMALPSDGSRLLVAGSFATLAGVTNHAIGSVDPVTGASEPWAADNILLDTPACNSVSESVIISGQIAYVAGQGQQAGCYDGDFAANVSDGSLVWNSPCEGATAALFVLNNVLYKGSHMHDCSLTRGGAFGGFIGGVHRIYFIFRRLSAQNPTDGSFVHWFPTTNGDNGSSKGPEAFASDGTQLFVAGSFSQVNGAGQEGLTRFTPGASRAPSKPTVAPNPVGSAPGAVTITFPATTDADSGVLTYTLFRGTAAIGTTTAESWPWTQPTLRFTDSGLTPGSSVSYHYTASDGTTSVVSPTSAAITVPASIPTYPSTVAGLAPTLSWQLDDATGPFADSSGNGLTGDPQGDVTTQATGAISGDAAVSLDGSSGYIASDTALPSTASFTESAWINTSSVTGGVVVGTSTNHTGAGTADNTVWMDNDGQIVYGMQTPIAPPVTAFSVPDTIVRSPQSYNDGRWHQVVASYDGTTMSLFVDGKLAASTATSAINQFGGFLRVGNNDLSALPHVFGDPTAAAPESDFFSGSIDEVSVYPSALTPAQISALWAAGATAP